jgi:hypothetical protein
MKYILLKCGLLILAMYTMQSFDQTTAWRKTGSEPAKYEMGLDPKMERNNTKVNTIKSKEENIDGFGSYVIDIKPGHFAGRRIRITGYIMVNDNTTKGGLWVMTDGTFNEEPARDVNDDKIAESRVEAMNWKLEELEFYIPSDAKNIAYGAGLYGGGQIWFDHVKIEVVD